MPFAIAPPTFYFGAAIQELELGLSRPALMRPFWCSFFANQRFGETRHSVTRKLTVDTIATIIYIFQMDIISVRHKALGSYLKSGRAIGLDARVASRLRNMVAFLVAADDAEELKVPPNFGFHWLTGNRSGTAAMTVTRNWRLTFRVNEKGGIVDLDLEDYH